MQLSSFIGRERELSEIKLLLTIARLVTHTGAGGCGKTWLAVQVTAQVLSTVADGACFVELVSLADPALVTQRVAATLAIPEQPGQPLMAMLNDHLSD